MFRIIIISSVVITQVLIYIVFVRFLKTLKFYKPWFKWTALIPFVLIIIPFLYIYIFFGRNFQPPQWFTAYLMPLFYIWMGASLMIGVWLIIGKLISLVFMLPVWIMKIVRPLRERINKFFGKKEVRKVSNTRREFVKYATGAVAVYAFGGAAYGYFNQNNYEITNRDIHIDNLPPELKGFTIALISDIHAGQNMGEGLLRSYADAVNDLGSDIICIPGDLVNFSSSEAQIVIKSFRELKAKYGVYGSLGNHDFFQNPDLVAKSITEESPLKVLRNHYQKINVNGKDIFILGVDDTRSSGSNIDQVVLDRINELDNRLKNSEPTYTSSPKILLCHKPYGFDNIAKHELDLTLAGHTHGGQVVPFRAGRINISLAGFASKYVEGHYKIGKSNMYVSRGIGTIIVPLRLNCPPEITKIKLV